MTAVAPSTRAQSARDRYACATPGFEARLVNATRVLERATNQHAGRIVQATSLGAEDMVVTDLIARHQLPIALATLDTGMLHPQTNALMEQLEAHYNLKLRRLKPAPQPTQQFEDLHGPQVMRRSVELRKACCQLRKLEPLQRLLEGHTAWVTGLRREQSASRDAVAFDAVDDNGRIKISPLADWSWADVWHYIELHQVPTNPLHDEFYMSIGCAPCTRAVAVGEDPRAGRWWWEDGVKECGLHVKVPTKQRQALPSPPQSS
jgi:phosphoadenosine phosphosulfate reductase